MPDRMGQMNVREAFSQFISAGMFSMQRSDFSAAIKLFDKATTVDSQDLSPYVLRAKCHMLADPPAVDKALAEADKVVKMKPSDATGYVIAWNSLSKLKHYETAFKLIRIGMSKVSPQDPQRQYIEEIYDLLRHKLPESVTGGARAKRPKVNDATAPPKTPGRKDGMFGQYQLPNELVHIIFAYLPFRNLGRGLGVCKAWSNYIQKDTMLWTKIDLRGSNINNSVIEMVSKRARSQLRSFILNGTKVNNNGMKKIIAARPTQLSQVIFERCSYIDDTTVINVCKVFGNTLTRLSLIKQDITDSCLAIVLTKCTSLLYLDISDNAKVTDAGFKSWPATSCLMALKASGCIRLPGHVWSTEYLNLKELDMSSTSFDLSSIRKLIAFPMLKTLKVTGVDLSAMAVQNAELTLSGVVKEVTKSTLVNLTHLAITRQPSLDDETLQAIASTNKALTYVIISMCVELTDAGLYSLINCKELKNLAVDRCIRVTDAGIKTVLAQCNKLENLDISDIPGVSDVTLDAIVQDGESLTSLNVSNCQELSGHGILKLHKKIGRPLKALIMNCLATVSNDTIRSFQNVGVKVQGNLNPVKVKSYLSFTNSHPTIPMTIVDAVYAESADDSGFGPSVLGTKEYWDAAYEREIRNFEDTSDIGEIWFGEHAAETMVSWVEKHCQDDPNVPIVDLGCGNGHLLLGLAELGFTTLTGLDYSDSSIRLAQAISESKDFISQMTFHTADILDPSSISPKFDSKFMIALDKGTYDAISLAGHEAKVGKGQGHIVDGYSSAVARMLNDEGGVLVITSCNWTEEELIQVFKKDFDLVERIKHKSFTFGGKTGSTIVTLILKKKSRP
ncbi:hypothetical protein SeLEV6574_g07067 [Synchytrium endobioticum]|uniref:Protein-lysine N-methyltransferase EFM4 n=1 Tax=Synchytrium endobioticum TaxID=286115 RepID=A0A507CJ97_9FUNG|nr:hypothetical protein SeLEV6574_g07067 [Synchytrium endobioticum]